MTESRAFMRVNEEGQSEGLEVGLMWEKSGWAFRPLPK